MYTAPKWMRRNIGLGQFNAPRHEWALAYRSARTRHRCGCEADTTKHGVWWYAQVVVYNHRGRTDRILAHPDALLAADRLIDEILAESSSA